MHFCLVLKTFTFVTLAISDFLTMITKKHVTLEWKPIIIREHWLNDNDNHDNKFFPRRVLLPRRTLLCRCALLRQAVMIVAATKARCHRCRSSSSSSSSPSSSSSSSLIQDNHHRHYHHHRIELWCDPGGGGWCSACRTEAAGWGHPWKKYQIDQIDQIDWIDQIDQDWSILIR